jgi:hypothetical protein
MNPSLRAYSTLIFTLALASPAFAQTWNPVSSDSMNNTAMGTGALANPSLDGDGGCHNTASGAYTLAADTSGSYNVATGFSSLISNLTGDNNTGLGAETLYSNTSGSNNSASGYQALYNNTTGSYNSATGANALSSNTSGASNSADGASALAANTTGYNNTASGYQTLAANTTGYDNAAAGAHALGLNTTGSGNAASGYGALYKNTTGTGNTGSGEDALYDNTTGSYNIAVGQLAGHNLTTGSYNIDIGNLGVAGESSTIRIGSANETRTFIAGISASTVTGAAVYVTSSGQLGVLASSERFKTDIRPMGEASDALARLRPVSFTLKNDTAGTRQYGLIAEEVAKVYPELVIRDSAGEITGMRYEELAPMLLNEVQKQAAEIEALKLQAQAVSEMQKQLAAMQAALLKVQSEEPLVAQQ